MNGKEDRNVDGMKWLVVAAVVIHDLQPAAFAANGADQRLERAQWKGVMR